MKLPAEEYSSSLPPGRGSSGTGKTLLAMHYIYAGLQAGEPVVYVSFEENPKELLMEQQVWDLI
jgi:KaiC/GvpD/RAD55 family RecA-like ATPase